MVSLFFQGLAKARATAPRLYEQQELWPTKPAPEDTGFDLLGDVLTDVAAQNADSERFDRALLERIAGFKSALDDPFREMALAGRRYPPERAVAGR